MLQIGNYISFAIAISIIIILTIITLRKIKKNKIIKLSDMREKFFNNYNIPEYIRDRFLKDYPQYAFLNYNEIESVLMDFLSIFLKDNTDKYYSSPSIVANNLWHTLLLYNKEYNDFCINSFNKIIYHNPHYNNMDDKDIFPSIYNTFLILKRRNNATAFLLDEKLGIKNKYNFNFMYDIYYMYEYRGQNKNNLPLLNSLGLIINLSEISFDSVTINSKNPNNNSSSDNSGFCGL